MFVVNFLGGYAITHYGLKHNDRFFTWADSIMPSFMFACGFSYRLSVLRRLPLKGAFATYFGVVRRSLGLVLVSLAMYGLGNEFKSWSEVNPESVKRFIARGRQGRPVGSAGHHRDDPDSADPRRRQELSHASCRDDRPLGAAYRDQLVVQRVVRVRQADLDGRVLFGLEGRRAWDGGCFGLISWAVPMVAGTLVYDVVMAKGAARSIAPLLASGVVLMTVGYGLSCLSRLYDVREGAHVAALEFGPALCRLPRAASVRERQRPTAQRPARRTAVHADRRDRSAVDQLLDDGQTHAVAVVHAVCDRVWHRAVCRVHRLVRPGRNRRPAVSHVRHQLRWPPTPSIMRSRMLVHQAVPKDAPFWPVFGGFLVFFLITWMMVRFLEKNKIYLRL